MAPKGLRERLTSQQLDLFVELLRRPSENGGALNAAVRQEVSLTAPNVYPESTGRLILRLSGKSIVEITR